MQPLQIVITVAVLVWIMYRQYVGRFVSMRRTMVLPLVLMVIGVEQAGSVHIGWSSAGVTVVVFSLLVTAALGVVRGHAVRLSMVDGYLYQRGGVPSLVLWLVSIGIRVLVEVVAAGTPAGPAVAATIMLSFGVSLAAQGAVLAARVHADGRPLRPSGDRRRSADRSTIAG